MRHLIFCGNGCFFLCLEVRKSNIFEAVKESVTTRQAAEYYGVQVGRNGMACCPFHDDKHPSMKIDHRFHCFGCQADGDVIDFTARLFSLSSKEAALKLAEDFSVHYDAKGHDPPRRRPVKRKISEELRYRQAEQKCFRVLCNYLHLLERWEKEYAPQTPDEAWNPLFVEALQKKPYTEYLLDILLSGSMEERASVVAEYGKEVRKIEQRYQSLPLATRQAAMSAAEALAPERSVDEVRESLSVTEKGKPANTIGNCRTVFCHDPLLRGAIRLNLLTDRVDIVQDLGWRRNTSALTDTDVKYLLLYFEQTYGLTSEKKMTAALSIVANENCYHPIQDVLNGLVWDGTPRIRSCLHHFLGADESDYVEEMLKHFLLGAIRRVFRPGSKYEEMLCLVGGQGAGKSSFFRLLAIRDEWFSDDLKKLDDDRVYLKLQGHWIIEMSEMLATSSAKSIEEIRSFISRQKETYRTPYEAQPKDRLRQCVFGGSSNTLDFLPLDRAGNRRFLPIMIYPENAEVHILEDEDASRAYLLQVWAEAMTIYRSGHYSMKFSKSIQRQLVEVQKDFMPEDTEAGQIQGFLEHYTGSMVCSKQLFKEALGHTYDEPKRWQLHNINEIMNTVVTGWKPFSNPRMFTGYGRQRGWERDVSGNELPGNEDGFVELTEEECCQLELPKEWIA